MQFCEWREDMHLRRNRFGIPEPAGAPVVDLAVAYDRVGNRLGMGAGYYDRHLEPLRHMNSPVRLGVAYSFQEIAPIEEKSWDVPLHGLVNEKEQLTFVEWITPGHFLPGYEMEN